MVSGGARFTGSKPRPPTRVIDVDVRPKHDTLYDALVVSPEASTREIRRVAQALRRNHPDGGALHDICLAEEVLGRAALRAEYDALLARLRAAGQPVPKIGTAIEASPLGPSFATRVGNAGRTGASAVGALLKVAFGASILIGVCVAIGTSSKTRRDPIEIHVPKFDYHPLPKFDFDTVKFQRELDQQRLDFQNKLDQIPPPKIELPPLHPPRPRKVHRPSTSQTLPEEPSSTLDGTSGSATTTTR